MTPVLMGLVTVNGWRLRGQRQIVEVEGVVAVLGVLRLSYLSAWT